MDDLAGEPIINVCFVSSFVVHSGSASSFCRFISLKPSENSSHQY